MVTVTAEDPLGASSSIPVTIEVTDVDEAPDIMLGGLAVSGHGRAWRYAEDRRSTAVATYTVAQARTLTMATWSLVSGDDARAFSISNSAASSRSASVPGLREPGGRGR